MLWSILLLSKTHSRGWNMQCERATHEGTGLQAYPSKLVRCAITRRQQLPCIKRRAPWYILVESICEYYVNHSSGQYYLDYCYIHNKDTIMIRTSETTDSIRFKHPFIHNAYVNLIQILCFIESRILNMDYIYANIS